MKLRVFGAVVLFAAGTTLGLLAYAVIDPSRFSISTDAQVMSALAAGAIVTALLAVVATVVGGVIVGRASRDAAATSAALARDEAEAARRDARRQALIDRQRTLRSLIAARSSRHTREVQAHVVQRQQLGGHPYQALPEITKTIDLEDAVVELYTLGFQKTADVAEALLKVMVSLDAFCFVATPESLAEPIPALSVDQMLDCVAWSEVEAQVRADLMHVGLTDQGVDDLAPGGTLEQDYLAIWFRQARGRRAAGPSAPPPPKRA